MLGPELRVLRESRGLSLYELGQALGYAGKRQSMKNILHRYETRDEPVPPRVVLRLVELGWVKPYKRRA
jgi:transcriptional regulator with XRE-family HTH domain